MRVAVLVASVAALVLCLSACTPDAGSSTPDLGADSPTKVRTLKPNPPVEVSGLNGRELCALLPKKAVERAMHAKVREAAGDSLAKRPFTLVSCVYGIEFQLGEVDRPPTVQTLVSLAPDSNNQKTLDKAFTNFRGKVVKYRKVEGLGSAAGFGTDADWGRLGGNQLVATFEAAGQHYLLLVGATPKATPSQLKPLAKTLLSGLAKKLGG